MNKKPEVLELTHDDLENDLIILGLVGMIDPARPEVKDAIIETKKCWHYHYHDYW